MEFKMSTYRLCSKPESNRERIKILRKIILMFCSNWKINKKSNIIKILHILKFLSPYIIEKNK